MTVLEQTVGRAGPSRRYQIASVCYKILAYVLHREPSLRAVDGVSTAEQWLSAVMKQANMDRKKAARASLDARFQDPQRRPQTLTTQV